VLGLSFRITSASPVPFAASPLLAFVVEVTNGARARSIHSGLLRCQVQIEASARAYDPDEAGRLRDLFGEGPVWGRALRRLLWTQATAILPPFEDKGSFEVHAPCSYDLSVASAQYLFSLPRGEVPIAMLFSGTVFSTGADGALEASPVSWSSEARFVMPARVWQETVDHYYAGCASLPVSRGVLERLIRYRSRAGFTSLDQAVESLLPREAREPEDGGPS
jgi:hypothetical protein